MKYVARVYQVLTAVHIRWTGKDAQGNDTWTDMPVPDYIEIVPDGTDLEPCMAYRYKDDGTFCGDSWHENVAFAKYNAEYEYGITASEWLTIAD